MRFLDHVHDAGGNASARGSRRRLLLATILVVLLASVALIVNRAAEASSESGGSDDGAVAELNGGATPTAQAVRLTPPEPHTEGPPPPVGPGGSTIPGRCTQYEPLLEAFNPGWDVAYMSRIMYRESRCFPSAANSCCTGLLQLHRIWLPNPLCGAYTRHDLTNPATNVCVATAVWRAQSYGGWSTA